MHAVAQRQPRRRIAQVARPGEGRVLKFASFPSVLRRCAALGNRLGISECGGVPRAYTAEAAVLIFVCLFSCLLYEQFMNAPAQRSKFLRLAFRP